MRKLINIALKDVRLTTRNRGALIILLAFPSALILILGLAFGGLGGGPNFSGIPVAIVNLDHGEVGEQIADGLAEDEELAEIVDLRRSEDTGAIREAVESGELAAALVIPEGFTDDIESSTPTELEVLQDPGSAIAAGVWTGIVRSVATDVSGRVVAVKVGLAQGLNPGDRHRGIRSGSDVEETTARALAIANEPGALSAVTVRNAKAEEVRQPTSLDYYAASMTSMFLLFGCMYGAFSFVEERDRQTLARMLASPTAHGSILGGKLSAVFLLGLGQFAILYTFTRVSLQAYWGDPAGVWLIVIGEMIATAGLAALISGIARTRRSVGGIAPVVVQLMALIGGAFFPVFIFPEWLQPIQYLSIVGWAMDGLLALQNGAVAADVVADFAAMVAMGVVFFAFGVWRLRVE